MVNSRRLCVLFTSMFATVLMMSLSTAYGSGFAIMEQSASGIGNALSGGTAGSIDDASTIAFNPAALTALEDREIVVGAHLIAPTFEFDNEGSRYPLIGMPVSGGDGGNGGEIAFVPNLYGVQSISEDVVFGAGITAPFGLMTEYDSDWVGRYQGIKSHLQSVNVNPTIAWKVSERISLAAGVSAQHLEAELTSAIDFGSILADSGVAGVTPQMLDGDAKIEGDDWGYGFNAGLVFTPTVGSQIGLSYRSSVDHTLEGDATFGVPIPAKGLQTMGLFVDTDAEADLETPASASIGLSQVVNEKVELMVDVMWTGWSCFEELRVEYDSMQPDSVTEEEWNDTWRYAIGINYVYDETWTFRAGTAYDETPVPDEEHRTPRIPDGDRWWLSVGTSYQASEDLRIDAGYTRLLFNETETEAIGSTGDQLIGSYEGSADIGSIQLVWGF